jgi:hypothetical protein
MAAVAGLACQYRFRSASADHMTWLAEVKPDGETAFRKKGELTFNRAMKIYGDASAVASTSMASDCADMPVPSLTVANVTTASGAGTADFRGFNFGPCELPVHIEHDTVFDLGR